MEGEICEKIGEINYNFFRGKRFLKTVHFFLVKYVGGSIRDHDFEADRVKWFPVSEALRVLTYVNERKIMRKAEGMLKLDSGGSVS